MSNTTPTPQQSGQAAGRPTPEQQPAGSAVSARAADASSRPNAAGITSAARVTAGTVRAGVDGAQAGSRLGGGWGAAAGAAAGVGLHELAKKDGTAGKIGQAGSQGLALAAAHTPPATLTAANPTPTASRPPSAGAAPLGAGGTSLAPAAHHDPHDAIARVPGAERAPGTGARAVAATAGVAAGAQAAWFVAMIALLGWMKSLFFASLAAAANLLQAVWHVLVVLAKAVTTPFLAAGAAVSSLVGGAVSATTAAAASGGATALAVLVTGASLWGGLAGETTMREGNLDTDSQDCGPGSFLTLGDSRLTGGCGCVVAANQNPPTDGPAPGPGVSGPVSASTEASARVVYRVLSSRGMPQVNIAGILGNWDRESNIDPTSVEGIFNEPFRIGPAKLAAQASGFSHMGYVDRSGIGLGQWTGGRNQLLVDYAEHHGKDWWDLNLQLSFLADGDNPSDVQVFRHMLTTSLGTPGDAAMFFHDRWERSADGPEGLALRRAEADKWYARISDWEPGPARADADPGGLLDALARTVTAATPAACDSGGDGDGLAGGAGAQVEAAGLRSGGLGEAGARALIDLYVREGDAFLDARYGPTGGPASCGSNHHENCVSFSTYFMNKYTSFQRYASGNGAATASSIASMTDRTTTQVPAPYSVFSHPNDGAGHTGVVLGMDGNRLLVGEAGYCSSEGQIRWVEEATWRAQGWRFVHVADLVTDPALTGARTGNDGEPA